MSHEMTESRLREITAGIAADDEKQRLAQDVCELRSYLATARAERDAARAARHDAYGERDRCVAAIAWIAHALGWGAGLGRHPATDTEWDRDWMTIVYIDLPTGQASWHIHDSELPLVDGLPPYQRAWDGHTTPEKYARVDKLGR